ncbi:MAG: amidohydrolase [Gemmatimonadetes bacterium]|nr:amidohydrolase [Gemmatimonadota bacterium]
MIATAGKIYTADAARPVASALAVRGGRIAYVGNARGALAMRGPQTVVLDLAGRTIIPGMVDAHAHLAGLGTLLRTVELVGTLSYEEVVTRVAARAREIRPGEWIRGRGWDQNDWPDTRFPTHEALSRAVPSHPAILTRVDGHALLVNARALDLAGITAATPDPEGGRIVRHPDGSPTGVLVDAAQELVRRVVPAPAREEVRAAVLAALAEANRWGLTGIHDAGVDGGTIEIYVELSRAGRFTLRDYVMIRSDSATLRRFFERGPQSALYDGRLWIRAIKMAADGALGSRGAALLEDYSDEPGNRGLVTTPQERIERVAADALRHGFQLNVHAIGDRGNRLTLDAFEAALRRHPVADHRFRIEHAQVLDRLDIPRFAELGVIPSMQASHQSSDMYWAVNRLGGTRSLGAYAWRSLLETGVVIPNGSDFPVESINPLVSFHAAITRQDASGWPAGGWFPAQRMTREEALLGMTLWPAYAAFMEDVSGSLTPGKYADFVVLDQDIMTVAPERLLDTRVVLTVLGGETIYEVGRNQ